MKYIQIFGIFQPSPNCPHSESLFGRSEPVGWCRLAGPAAGFYSWSDLGKQLTTKATCFKLPGWDSATSSWIPGLRGSHSIETFQKLSKQPFTPRSDGHSIQGLGSQVDTHTTQLGPEWSAVLEVQCFESRKVKELTSMFDVFLKHVWPYPSFPQNRSGIRRFRGWTFLFQPPLLRSIRSDLSGNGLNLLLLPLDPAGGWRI